MEPLDEILKWEEDLTKWLEDFRKGIVKMNDAIFQKLLEYIDRFDFSANINTNYGVLVEIQSSINSVIQTSGFVGIVGLLIGKIEDAIGVIENFFKNTFPNNQSAGVTSAFKAALANVRRSLLGEGVSQAYVSEIVKTLQFHVFAKSRKNVFREALKEILSENGKPIKYLTTYTSDALYQFTRAYTNEVTKSLGAQYFYYMGTKIKTTRTFCDVRAGKVYTKKEVQGWASNEWQGKIADTTQESIFVYAGGYNCRHRILPISKEMYDRMK